MEKIKLRVTGSQIEVVEHPAVITAGTIGMAVEFTFDSQWDNLAKTAVFKAGDKVVSTDLEKNTRDVPWEVLKVPNQWLCIGVYGVNIEGSVVIPTLWAKVAVVHTGVDPEGDPALDPTAPVWQTLLSRVEEIGDVLHDVDALSADNKTAIDSHINNQDGDNPHGVTCEQIGAGTREEMDTMQGHLLSLQDEVNGHKENAANPHSVTAEQVGAVPSNGFTDSVVAIAESLLDEQALNGHAGDFENPHYVTCEQIKAVTQEQHDADVQEVRDWAESEIALQAESMEYQISTHTKDAANPHGVTCEQIGAATKEEVEAALAENKAIIVTVASNTSSLTTQEICDAVVAGKAVYLKMWSSTYTLCSSCTPDEAKFESSYSTSITGADGKSYACQAFRMFVISNSNKVTTISHTTASVDYINAQIAYALSNQ